MSELLKNRNSYSFLSNNGVKFTIYGESAEIALMEHLCTQTKLAEHQLSYEDASDPKRSVMIHPKEFVNYFGSFEEAAKMAWDAVSEALTKEEQCCFKMNDGTRFTGYGDSEKDVLMKHLVEKTKEVGHRLSFDEANNPECVVMVRPSTFALVFGSFDWAADKAWQHACIE